MSDEITTRLQSQEPQALSTADNKDEDAVQPKAVNEEASLLLLSPGKQLCDFCAMLDCSCGCPQLEAEPIRNNTELLTFKVRSRDIDWRRYVQPLDTEVRAPAVYLDKQTDFVSAHRRQPNASNRRELLVCHDMMGNYLADKHFQSSEKYDDYRFVHWSAVDYFCYFSHSYVTIPPSGWINAAHRHGVPVLGTYIVEGDTLLNEVLASPDSVERAVAALTRLCLHFQFEGWLVNVECAVRPTAMNNLYLFVEKLRLATETQVPHGRVFWYDSVIDSGQLNWQNELNERNVQFFRRSHAMLINYSWNDRSLETSAAVMEEEQAAGQRLFMGLDVFGRGQLAKFQSAQTLSRIARRGFSAGIFAPGWCFETLSRFGYNIHNTQGDESVNAAFLARNERWWSRLWPWLGTHAYRKLPFYTDFCVGSGRSSYQCGARSDERGFFNLARQALQPSVPLDGNAEHSFDVAFAGGCALRMLNYERAFRLFLTQFELPLGVLLLGYAHKLEDHAMDIVLRCSVPGKQTQDLYLFCGAYAASILTPGLCYMPPLATATLAPQLQHVQLAGQLTDNWQVRYYLIRFDGPVQLLDIGVKCRRPAESSASSYLGAIYVQRLQLTDWQAAAATMGKVELPAYQTQLWNAAPAPQAAAAE